MIDLKELKRIISIFEKASISELEVEAEGIRVRLKKGLQETVVHLPQAVTHLPQVATQATVESVQEEASVEWEKKFHEILSPMVGTFYDTSSPDSPSYVEVGQEVKEDDTVCLIEAMKIMNEIKAGVNGRIVKVLAKKGEPVEFGQPLFLVEPLSK